MSAEFETLMAKISNLVSF